MGCKPSKSAVREPRGLTEQGIGKIAGGHSSLAHSPPKPCGRTRMELDGLMECGNNGAAMMKEAGEREADKRPAKASYDLKMREKRHGGGSAPVG